VDPGLDENQAELGILVTAVLLEMLANSYGLLDEVVKILGDAGAESVGLENAHYLASSDVLYLGNTVGVTKNDTDLAGSETLPGELANVVAHFAGGGLEPAGGSATVGQGGA